MKSAQKGIEMKLIQILALAIAMATVATAQNSGASGQPQALPTPTPAATTKTGAAKPAAKKAANSAHKSDAKTTAGTAAKKSPGTAAKKSNADAASTKADPTPKSGTPSTTSTKPTVKTSTAPVKPLSPTGTQAKGAPTPVVAAKEGTKAASQKTDAKKTAAKKTAPAKTPAVIAVKPVAPVKNTGAKQTKAAGKPTVTVPAKAPAPGTAQKAPAVQAAEKPKPAVRAFGAHGRRDPFVSPIVSKDGITRPAPNCTSGKRCLVIPELVLQGTVKDTSGKMMAVVANSIKKTYFLRENDQVFQGSVEKITSDSIIFREYVKDALGRETAREVVKKLVPPS
jgi:Tfp pilus assembly protein PilP